MNNINVPNFRLWLEALRSDKYQQGFEYLCNREEDGSYSFCALGVACELAIENGVPIQREGTVYVEKYTGKWEQFLPFAVRKWLGINSLDLEVRNPKDDEEATVTTLNDDLGLTFEQIADLLEERYLSRKPTCTQ